MDILGLFIVCCFICFFTGLNAREKWTAPSWVDFLYPEIAFINKAEHTEGWKIYNRIIPNPEEFIQQHALWVAQTLYWNVNDSMPEIRKIRYSYEDKDGISAKGGSRSAVHIFYSSQWVEKTAEKSDDAHVLYETRGVLYHELTHAYQLEPQGIGGYKAGTEFWVFIEGMADAVRYHNGFFPVSSRKPGGKWMDGYRTTGFFLEWLTCKDPDFLRKFNASTRTIIPWSFDKAMQSIFSEKITTDSLWEEYQAFLCR
jgi:hypothetical protein